MVVQFLVWSFSCFSLPLHSCFMCNCSTCKDLYFGETSFHFQVLSTNIGIHALFGSFFKTQCVERIVLSNQNIRTTRWNTNHPNMPERQVKQLCIETYVKALKRGKPRDSTYLRQRQWIYNIVVGVGGET